MNQKIIQWASHYLLSQGYMLKSGLPEDVQNTPWSYVIRFATNQGYIYLKHTPELLALEPKIIEVLHDKFHAHVPVIIAYNPELHCFLMRDAGESLRKILKKKFDASLIYKTIEQFTSLQLSIAEQVDILLNIGVPDWRLDKLPDLYKQLLSQRDLLIADGLSEVEIDKLESLIPMVIDLCKKLSAYAIKQTMVQPDFNDNNTLIDDVSQKITIIDLGEIAITHPFFSLINFLHVIKKHHALTDTDDVYLRIKNACLENYMRFESQKNLLDALEIAGILLFIYGALCGYRLMIACDRSKFTPIFQRHGRPSLSLKEFINVSKKESKCYHASNNDGA